MRRWKPSKAKISEFIQQMNEIDEFCKQNNISQSVTSDSYYFEINGKKYRISNHSVESSNINSHGKYHNEGRSENTIYIHASKTRLIEIYKLLKNGIEVDGKGRKV